MTNKQWFDLQINLINQNPRLSKSVARTTIKVLQMYPKARTKAKALYGDRNIYNASSSEMMSFAQGILFGRL